MQNIIVIDSNSENRFIIKRLLSKHSYHVIEKGNCIDALSELNDEKIDLVIYDLKPDQFYNKLNSELAKIIPLVPVIILSSLKEVKGVVELMKLGVSDYLLKPLSADVLLKSVQTTVGNSLKQLNEKETSVNQKPVDNKSILKSYVVGESKAFKDILNQMTRVAPTNYSIIIYGETGSGKEVIAQEIHKQSSRKHMPFVAIDCGAISKELAGSELFGHEKGSFTGAHNQRIGNFEIANGGTIFLDEIANLPYEVQVSLLRVVQERKLRRLGGAKEIELDIRIIVASNESLWDNTRQVKSSFREDLFHRFNEFTITVPPLRERKDDIEVFAKHFLALANRELKKNILNFSDEVYAAFNNYHWHGNLRELKNVVKRAALISDGNYIDIHSLPHEVAHYMPLLSKSASYENKSSESTSQELTSFYTRENLPTIKSVSIDAEYELIIKVLKEVNFNKVKAAKVLNIDRKTLYNKLDEYQLKVS